MHTPTRDSAPGPQIVLVIATLIALGVVAAVLARTSGAAPAGVLAVISVLILVPLFVSLDRHHSEKQAAAPHTDHWADQEPFGRPLALQRTDPRTGAPRTHPRPPPNPRHMIIAGGLLLGASLLIVVTIAAGGVEDAGRVLSGAVIALVFTFIGALLLHVGTVRARWRRQRGIPLDLEP